MISKIIHYCWFGKSKKPELVKKCIESWKRYCPDYQIIEWNEKNYNIDSAPIFVQQALKKKLWAFASDYIRYQVVYQYGGIYLDTDVELLKSPDSFLNDVAFFGFEKGRLRVASGLGFGAEKGLGFLMELMKLYESIPFVHNGFIDLTTNICREQEAFSLHGLTQNGKTQVLDNRVIVYSDDVFCPFDPKTGLLSATDNTVSIHWYGYSWRKRRQKVMQRKKRILTIRKMLRLPIWVIKTVLGKEKYEIIRNRILNYFA